MPVGLAAVPAGGVGGRRRSAAPGPGVPEEHRRALAKTDIALAEIDRVLAAGARFGRVVADAGYGISAAFRQGLSERGLVWAVGIPKVQNVYSTAVELRWPVARTGRPRKHPVPSEEPVPAEAGAGGRRVAPRLLAARHQGAARGRVRRPAGAPGRGRAAPRRPAPAGRGGLAGRRAPRLGRAQVLPRQPAAGRALEELAALIKARWVCEQAHQQLKEELGLDHFEGRSWTGPAPARADGDDRLLLPPAPAAAGAGGKARPDRRDRRRGRPCPRSGAGCSRGSASPSARCPCCGADLGPLLPSGVPR